MASMGLPMAIRQLTTIQAMQLAITPILLSTTLLTSPPQNSIILVEPTLFLYH
jgi:hypothetical protein